MNTPPPKGGGFRLRLKAGSVRHAADSGHLEVVIRLRRHLVFDVLHPDLVSDIAAARDPVAPRPQVLTPVAFTQNAELAQRMPVLRHPHHMILAVPNGMAAALVRSIQPLYALIPRDPTPPKGVGFPDPLSGTLNAWFDQPGRSLTAGNVGLLLGSLSAGLLGDRLGSKPVLIGCVAVFGVFSLVTAFAGSPLQLAAVQFLTGLGLGGGIPLAIALASDFAPPMADIADTSQAHCLYYLGERYA